MKRLKNALLLKQLYLFKAFGYRYTETKPFTEDTDDVPLPDTLESLHAQIRVCHLCNYAKSRRQAVTGRGKRGAKVMILSAAPTLAEDESGTLPVGKSKEMLDNILQNVLHLLDDDVYITSFLKCRPPANESVKQYDIHSCKPFLLKEIDLISPRYIVALGVEPFEWLSGISVDLTQSHGIFHDFSGYPLMPTFSFSYLLRNPALKKEAYRDWLRLAEALKREN